ncbi:MAG: hypothetical protein ACK5KR_03770 [Breznakia sp.]
MEYIKKNKVFIFLISILVLSISILSVVLLKQINNEEQQGSGSETNQVTKITSFNVHLDDRMQLVYNWNVSVGKEAVEKTEIFHGNKFLVNVSNTASYSLDFLSSNIPMGNNAFTFKVYLKDSRVLEKTIYYYIDEVLDFEQMDAKQGDTLEISVSYLYAKEKKETLPKVSASTNPVSSFQWKFKDSSIISQNDRFIRMQTNYEFDLSNMEVGRYTMSLQWGFNEYDIHFDETVYVEILPD